jgi:hypothetical protein
MGQHAQQGFNTLLASFIALVVVETFDTAFVAPGMRDTFVVMAGAGLGTVLSVMIEVGRQIVLRISRVYGIDLSKVLGS